MKEDAKSSYYYSIGQSNAEAYGSKAHSMGIEDDAAFFYFLGMTYWDYKSRNCPTRCQLVGEIFRIFRSFTKIPDKTIIHLDARYSHRLLKEVFRKLGYCVPGHPDCNQLQIRRTTRLLRNNK